ncbi:MAG: hypothetical protein ACRYG4_23050 [Janthinobacterium lividum]
MRVIVLFNLKPGITPAVYEEWSRNRDIPGVRSLPSVDDFRVYRTTGLLGGNGAAPYAYVEVLDILDVDGFGTDSAGEASQQVARELFDHAEAPVFIVTEQIE